MKGEVRIDGGDAHVDADHAAWQAPHVVRRSESRPSEDVLAVKCILAVAKGGVASAEVEENALSPTATQSALSRRWSARSTELRRAHVVDGVEVGVAEDALVPQRVAFLRGTSRQGWARLRCVCD